VKRSVTRIIRLCKRLGRRQEGDHFHPIEQDYPVNDFSFDWPKSAAELLVQARSGVDLAKLIMAGTTAIDSWLIAHRILPTLHEKGLSTLCFSLLSRREKHCASCIPLPDGSAFVCNVVGLWLPLETQEAAHEIQYIGSRYAPGDHWQGGFDVTLKRADGTDSPLRPGEVATFWAELTGVRLSGFEAGIFDHIEAIGHGVADKVFTTQGRLGL
jgi:hypothetical protein